MTYDPTHWYWVVAGDTANPWSSADAAYVALPNAAYDAFIAANHTPTLIASEVELKAVLMEHYPAGWDFREAAKRQINKEAGETREKYLTMVPGQEMTYLRKEAQASACLAAYDALNPPPVGLYTALESEVGITGDDVLAVATVISNEAAMAGVLGDTIEAIRLDSKHQVDLAPDRAAVEAILAGIVWP